MQHEVKKFFCPKVVQRVNTSKIFKGLENFQNNFSEPLKCDFKSYSQNFSSFFLAAKSCLPDQPLPSALNSAGKLLAICINISLHVGKPFCKRRSRN
mmetsp:Transcript_40600/g.56430  ORF Transcript_40600/g.56430 Transcript_40600/m.56430 type:complete len:97 (+) Transcript_40600:265-555(+)